MRLNRCLLIELAWLKLRDAQSYRVWSTPSALLRAEHQSTEYRGVKHATGLSNPLVS